MTTRRNLHLFFFLFSFIFLTACADDEDIIVATGVFVVDFDNVFISGATVKLYQTREDYLNDKNPIVTVETDANGLATIPYSDSVDILFKQPVYLSAQRGGLVNWADQVIYTLEFNGNTIPVVSVRETLLTRLAGRGRQSWDVVNYVIDNRTLNNCQTLVRYTFEYNANYGIAQTPSCGGRFLSSNIWEPLSLNSFRNFDETRFIADYTPEGFRMTYNFGVNITVQEDLVRVVE
ncbi:MAG: hypothetical protein ACFCUI_07035 [Bernardetiaceae bacterium]